MHTYTVRTHVRIVHKYVVSVRTHVRMHSTHVRTYTNHLRTHLLRHTIRKCLHMLVRPTYVSVETKIVDRSEILKNRSDFFSKNGSVNFIVFLYQKCHFQFNQTYE